jgi:hypothetical protein
VPLEFSSGTLFNMLRHVQNVKIDSQYQPHHRNICVKMLGGLGDCIMAASIANNLLEGCRTTLACRPHLVNAMNALGLVQSIALTDLNSVTTQQKYDAIIDVSRALMAPEKRLTAEDYYSKIGETAGVVINEIPCLNKKREEAPKIVYLHPGASNPNRRWPSSHWRVLAKTLASVGFDVLWLGARDEFGYNGRYVHKLSDNYPELAQQISFMQNSPGYFIGNDSGFLHVAGVLGLDGLGIFGNTSPDNVISRYKNLIGITSGRPATRTLDITDTNGIEALLPDAVLGRFLTYVVADLAQKEEPPVKETLYVPSLEDAPTWAALNFRLLEGSGEPSLTRDAAGRLCLTAGEGKAYLSDAHPEMSVRGAREAIEAYLIKLRK